MIEALSLMLTSCMHADTCRRGQLQYEYPDRYEEMAADAVLCREDTNLLQISDEGEERLFSNFESTKRRQTAVEGRHPQAPPFEPD